MAILNVGLSIVLCKFYGIIGVSIGTTLSLVIANGIIMNIYYKKAMHLNIGKFWIQILKMLPGFILPIAVGIFLMFIGVDQLWLFPIEIICYTAVYCLSIYFLSLDRTEKTFVKRIFKHSK